MGRLSNWLDEKLFFLRTGSKLKIVNEGKEIEHLVISYKGIYFGIMLDAETGEPTGDFGWSEDYSMFSDVPIRDFWTATPPPKKGGK